MGAGRCRPLTPLFKSVIARYSSANLEEEMHLWRNTLIAVAVAAVGGCATIMEGTGQSVAITTSPAGANCNIDRGGGRLGQVSSPPASIRVEESKNDLGVSCS